ncbi:EcsC family protein [Microcoleus sp. FACHB-672]|uniref:EcsC family protein n=1 Tax=Microcoleus sp. FACHB-672 TaxID=2692825 RepID=UPI0016847E86|nr:EcsC family protein [Microcoleus sp. FACHB-672]MBD2041301.1 hypothetical protein [Microcoleus sp. FACHB-672]
MTQPNFWQSLTKTATGFGETISNAAAQATQAATDTAAKAGEAISSAASGTAAKAGEAIGSAASGTAAKAGEAIGSAASGASIAVAKTAAKAGEAISNGASGATVAATETALKAKGFFSSAASGATAAATEKAAKAGEAIGSAVSEASQAVVGKSLGVSGVVAGAASGAGKAVVGKATEVGGAIANTASKAGQTVAKKATNAAAPIMDATGKKIQNAKNVTTDWLIRFIDKVDVPKAEAEVRQLQQQYPNEEPRKIAHRLMVDKTVLAAGSGLASNLVPGAALAMAGVDLAAMTALSAELIYQIAAAYGQDLQSSARKGEVITIFTLSMSGTLALEAGLGWLGNVPVAGAMIGASTNAAMIYALGYGACRFYEAKKRNSLILEGTVVDCQVEGEKYLERTISQEVIVETEKYLEGAISQEVIMDQILIHVFLAGNPDKTGEELLPELQILNLSPASLEAITANIQSPPSLETLLAQINSDFAVPLLVQCQKIAQLDGVVTPEETQVIETIINKFGININNEVK